MIILIINILIAIFFIPVVLGIVGFAIKQDSPKVAKTLFIIAITYLIVVVTILMIGIGLCLGSI